MLNPIFLIARNLSRTCRRNIPLLRADWLSLFMWPFLGVVSISALWLFYQARWNQEENIVQRDTLQMVSAASTSYAQQITRSLQGLNTLMQFIADEIENENRPAHLENLKLRGVFDAKPYVIVAVIDKDGVQKTTTYPKTKNISVADREYFQFHRTHKINLLRINKTAIGRISNKSLIQVTKRLNKKDGSFDGVILVGVDEDFFISSSSTINGLPTYQALIENNTVITEERPLKEKDSESFYSVNTQLCKPALQPSILPKNCFKDNLSRYIGAAPLAPYHYQVVIGLAEQAILQPLLISNYERRRILLACSILIAAFTFIAFFTSIRLRLKDVEAENIRRAYRIATENGKEGFYLWKRVFNSNGEIIDYKIADCNEYGAALYKMSKKEMIGKTITDIYGDTAYSKFVIAVGIQMDMDGEGEEEYEVPKPKSILQPDWIQRKHVRTYEGVAVTIRDISEKKLNEAKLDSLANSDTLTGIPNRNWMMTSLPNFLEKAEQSNSTVALFFIDLDDFKDINDSLGHAAGDAVLREVAHRISEVIREEDRVIRLGGDEFTVILNNASDQDYVANIATRLIKSFKTPFQVNNVKKFISASIGIARYPDDGFDAETLIQKADMAMYAAKTQKGQFLFFNEELLQRRGRIIKIEDELRQAVKNDEFVVHYQPRISSKSGAIVGFEALVRWNSPTRGLVQPLDFIPLAENSDLIILIGEIVIQKVAQQIKRWLNDGFEVAPVSINVSAKQFNASAIPGAIATCCTKESISASYIEVEITESAMMGGEEETIAQLTKLAEMGIKTHVDDFGTGYSSLSMLRRLSMDVLKIDRAFTMELGVSKETEILYKTMISMAHALGMKVIAEGVETQEQMGILRGLNCDELQGYLISKPLPAIDVTQFLENKNTVQKSFWPKSVG